MNPDGPDYQVTALRCRACETKAAEEDRWRSQDNTGGGIYFATTERSD